MHKKHLLTIAKKEFFSLLNSPLGYIITIPFLIITSFLYWRQIIISGQADLRPYFELLPWFMLVVIPALTMRSFAQEKSQGTLELLRSHPINQFILILAKFLGLWTYFTLILALTLLLPLTLLKFSSIDPGIILAQYLGAWLTSAALISIGLFFSTILTTTSAFLATAALGFVWILIGLDIVLVSVPFPFDQIINQFALLPHLRTFIRGLIDLRDFFFFLSFSLFFLIASAITLTKHHWQENKLEKQKLNLALLAVLGISIVTNLLLQTYPLKIDLTQNRLFSLSQGTKQTIRQLPNLVKVTFYVSEELPPQFQTVSQTIKDTLQDYSRLNSKFQYQLVTDPQIAQTAGIQSVTFNRLGGSKFEAQTGFLGLVIRFEDQTDTLPFIQNASDLEYQLTRRLRKMINPQTKPLAIYQPQLDQQFSIFREILSTQYELQTTSLTQEDSLENTQALIYFSDPQDTEATASAVVDQYLQNNGKALFLIDGVHVDPQTRQINPSQSEIIPLLEEYGLKINPNLVFDLQLNEIVTLTSGVNQYLISYPFWPQVLVNPDTDLPAISQLNRASLTWASSIEIKDQDNFQPLLITGGASGVQIEPFLIWPEQLDNLIPDDKQHTLAVTSKTDQHRLALITDTSIAADDLVAQSQENLALISNLVDWIAADESLAAITSKTGVSPILQFTSESQVATTQWVNILAPSVFTTAFGIFWLSRRRKLTRRNYS
jgi:ABC-2 type transport system permease protein